MKRCMCESDEQFTTAHAAWSDELTNVKLADPNAAANSALHSEVLRALGIDEPSSGIRVTDDVANERKRADNYKTALSAITSILDAVESARLEDNVDIDADELIAGIRKQLRNAWGL